jgi:hypothetical protein
LPAGRLIGKQGNALLVELVAGGVAVISAPRASITFADEGLPVVDLNWAFTAGLTLGGYLTTQDSGEPFVHIQDL